MHEVLITIYVIGALDYYLEL